MAMSMGDPGPGLRGRRSECEALDRVLAGVRAGQSRVLVLRGEAGVGKTALLEYLSERATGCRVARAAGVESEMELAFAGLHQLSSPFLERLERLPGPQRDALGTAFGLSTGAPPDRFLVGLAVLTLLAGLAEEEPLVCLVDDAQWLDHASAQTLAFVARRLFADRVGVVFAVREPGGEDELDGLPELMVAGLGEDDARALLDSVLKGPVDQRVSDRIVAETRGNPLALLELPGAMTPAELAGGFGLPDTMPMAGRIELGFLRRLQPLPDQTRRLLLAAAAEPVGDVTLLWRAAERLGIAADAAGPAEAAGLIEIGARVRFRHPLVRSAVYREATPEDRRAVHNALSDVTESSVDPDRRAWHRAHAAVEPDEAVAGELADAGGRVQGRGGIAAAAAFLQRAAELTPDPARRAERALDAAHAKQQAGAADAALSLLGLAEAGPPDELRRARADLLRGQIAFASSHGRDAPPLLLQAAQRLDSLDTELARDTYLDALSAALFVGRLAGDIGLSEVAAAARAAPASSDPGRAPDQLLEGLALTITEGYTAGASGLRGAVGAFREGELSRGEAIRWLWLATHAAHDLWDDEGWYVLSTRLVKVAREAGALAVLPVALSARAGLHQYAGEVVEAVSLVEEMEAVAEATGNRLPRYGTLALAAWRGREPDAAALIAASLEEAAARGEGMGLSLVYKWAAVLYNGLGRYSEALDAAEQAGAHPQELGFATMVLPELVEAASRCGRAESASEGLRRLSETTSASGTDWALGIEARSRALLSDGELADQLYREAIELLARTRVRTELARAHLLYGEWLRREGRRVDAREQLRRAHGMLAGMGAEAFAERARGELAATGETVRRRTVETVDDLTAQEAQIARLAADRRTNSEIGAQLFLSPRTVEWHLRKVFRKLGISSRKQLGGALPESERTVTPA